MRGLPLLVAERPPHEPFVPLLRFDIDKFEVRAVLAYDGPLFELELFVEF